MLWVNISGKHVMKLWLLNVIQYAFRKIFLIQYYLIEILLISCYADVECYTCILHIACKLTITY
jgi:hypothetical protein